MKKGRKRKGKNLVETSAATILSLIEMSDLDKKRIALLEATLREILRLEREAEKEDTAISFDDIFDEGRNAQEWKSIRRRAAHLV